MTNPITAGRAKPTLLQSVPYWYGKRLPNSMRAWVRRDLTGPGAAWRMIVRWSIPCILLLAPMWLLPTTLYVHTKMTVPILIPFVYFSIALNKVWRRHQLALHGFDPNLVDERNHARQADERRAYEQRYRAVPATTNGE
ncbi:hypothetical protein FOS14_15520 [Skermania sp. ID1734]|uniref:DUF5313 domain-containing protein n=1 Tax=Skermania sp. ID1734 TaxID=2597516 RepID=UPI00117C416E|nr:DUF5313 domain-containing protein [Skermania sp. ID1734]TSD97379.1 hypothetical protein FOS14_15520 [Skermania sp. ID1734]